MKNICCKFSITLMLLCLNIFNSRAQTALSQDPIYQLVFQDEFDSLGLRTSNWNPIWPWGPNIQNSNSATYNYGGSNVTLDVAYNYLPLNNNSNRQYDTIGNGYHRLISRKEPTSIQGDKWLYDVNGNFTGVQAIPYNFTTAMLFGKYKFKYAYVEMRFRTSNFSNSPYNAYAPNLWMWSPDNNAAYSEIDIFEMAGNDWSAAPCAHYRHFSNINNNTGALIPPPAGYTTDDTAFWHGNSFYPDYYNPSLRRHSATFTPGQWHTVGCEWTPEYIDNYYYSLSTDTFQRFPVNKFPVDKMAAMPLIIDNYTPAPRDTFYIPYDVNHTNNNFAYDIDYIKVWQVKQNCTSASFLNIASAGAYNNTLYQNLTIGGTGSTGCNFTSGNSHLAGNDYVLLQEGFEASGSNTTVLINTMQCQTGQTITYNSLTNPSPPPNFQLKRDIKLRQKR